MPDTHFGYTLQNAVLVREKSLKPIGYTYVLHFLEHLLEDDVKKWRTFKKVAPKSDAPSDDRYFDNFVVAPQYGAPFEK